MIRKFYVIFLYLSYVFLNIFYVLFNSANSAFELAPASTGKSTVIEWSSESSLLRRVVINRKKRSILPWISYFLSSRGIAPSHLRYLRKYHASPARTSKIDIIQDCLDSPRALAGTLYLDGPFLPSSSSGNVQRRSSLNCRWKPILTWLAMLLFDVEHLWGGKRLYIQCEIESRSRGRIPRDFMRPLCTSLPGEIDLRILFQVSRMIPNREN